MTKTGMILSLVLPAVLLVSCGPKAWMVREGDERLIGSSKAGGPVFDRLVKDTTESLLAKHQGLVRANAGSKMLIAFAGIINKSAEELGDIRHAIFENVETILFDSMYYDHVSRHFIDAALREANIRRVDDLFLESKRASFLRNLSKSARAPEFLLIATVTTQSTRGEGARERDYQLTLEMVNAKNGLIIAKETKRVSKGYDRH